MNREAALRSRSLLRLFSVSLVAALLVAVLAAVAFAQVSVRGYFRRDGTYVRPHVRSAPDGNPFKAKAFSFT